MSEILRRLEQMFIIGTVAEIDGPRARVQSDDLLTDFLPLLTRAGDDISWDGVDLGEQVLVFSPGDPAQGVILGSLYADESQPATTDPSKHHRRYKDGAVIEYDRSAKHLKAILPAGATTELKTTGGLSIEGDTDITGDLSVSGNVSIGGNLSVSGTSSQSGAVSMPAGATIDGIPFGSHQHPETGDGGGTTGTPQ